MSHTQDFAHIDQAAFAQRCMALKKDAEATLGAQDVAHMRRLEWVTWACAALGYGSAWLAFNPLSALLMSVAQFSAWTIFMHHLGHKGFDKVPGAPKRWHSRHYAQGWRRFLDFPDWMVPAAWLQEHNVLHHSFTGDMGDPDLVERDVAWLRRMKIPTVLKYAAMVYFSASWKLSYYVPRTMRALQYLRARRLGLIGPSVASTGGKATCDFPWDTRALAPSQGTVSPFTARGRETGWRCVLPYVCYRFIGLPLLFAPLGASAVAYVWLNSLAAELLCNVHAFLVIAPNHCGDDVLRFETPVKDKGEWYLRSVLGSVNYQTGHPVGDFLHGYLNYQIEHHVWPDLPPRQLQLLQPKLKALCGEFGVPYVQEALPYRVRRLFKVMSGEASMPVGVTQAQPAAAVVAPVPQHAQA